MGTAGPGGVLLDSLTLGYEGVTLGLGALEEGGSEAALDDGLLAG